jgi:hypothetical protein
LESTCLGTGTVVVATGGRECVAIGARGAGVAVDARDEVSVGDAEVEVAPPRK